MLEKSFGHTRSKVMELVRAHLPAPGTTEHTPRILELSCGDGAVLKACSELGFEVAGTNFSRYPLVDESLPLTVSVDLQKPLPFEDDSFDCVIISETLQNIPDHLSVLKSVRSVLREGGVFILTTPNMQSIKSRLHFLLSGFFKVKWKFIGFDVPLESAFGFHNHPVHLPVLLYYLNALDMEPLQVDGIYVKPKSRIFYWLFIWLIKPFTWLTTRYSEKYLRRSGASGFVHEALTSKTSLCSDRLAVVARKHPESERRASGTRLPSWGERYDAPKG